MLKKNFAKACCLPRLFRSSRGHHQHITQANKTTHSLTPHLHARIYPQHEQRHERRTRERTKWWRWRCPRPKWLPQRDYRCSSHGQAELRCCLQRYTCLFSPRRPELTVYSGELQSVDGYMNIALEDTKEYVEGKLRRNYGDAFVRGNNGQSTALHSIPDAMR